MRPHCGFMVDVAPVIGSTPRHVRFGGREASSKPDDAVVMNDPPTLQLSDPAVTELGRAGAAVVPLAQGHDERRDVLGAPIAVVPGIGQGLHPDLLVLLALVVQLLRSNPETFSQAGNAGLLGVDHDGVFCHREDNF